MMNTKWFAFRQNNSGGSFDHEPEEGIGTTVFVEATDAAHAKDRAERIGLYFDGCAKGMDCSCCGDRWSEWLDDDDGTESPEQYGEKFRAAEDDDEPYLYFGIPLYMHYIGGAFKAVVKA